MLGVGRIIWDAPRDQQEAFVLKKKSGSVDPYTPSLPTVTGGGGRQVIATSRSGMKDLTLKNENQPI